MNNTKKRLITQFIGAVLIVVLVSISVAVGRALYQFYTAEHHPCGTDRAVVYNNSEHDIIVVGMSLQEDGSVQDVEITLPPNQSSEEAGLCSVYEMTVIGTKAWFYKGMKMEMEMRSGAWMVLSTPYTYCVSGEELSTEIQYDVLCTEEPASTQ